MPQVRATVSLFFKFGGSCLENTTPWQRRLAGHSLQGRRVGQDWSDPAHTGARLFFYLQQLCPRESWAWRWRSCLACGDPGSTNCAGIWTASAAGVMALVESFSRPLWLVFLRNLAHSGTSRAPLSGVLVCCLAHQAHRGGPLTGVLFCRWAHQALKGAALVGSFSVDGRIRHLKGHPGWGPTL